MNMYKYDQNYQPETDNNIIDTMIGKNYSIFSNKNYGNNFSKQLDLSNPQNKNVLDDLPTYNTKSYNSSGSSGMN